jgi:hypothetical protein
MNMVTSTKRAISPMRQIFERLTPGKPTRWPVEISFVIAPLIPLVMANPDDII